MVHSIGIDIERKLLTRSSEMIEQGQRDTVAGIERKLVKLNDDVHGYYARITQLDSQAKNALLDVENTNNRFSKKVDEVTDRWMVAVGKEAKVRVQLKQFGDQINKMSESLFSTHKSNEHIVS